jgi:hypothetical protein
MQPAAYENLMYELPCAINEIIYFFNITNGADLQWSSGTV